MIAVAMVSFFAGTLFSAHMNMQCTFESKIRGDHHFINDKVEDLAQKRLRELQGNVDCKDDTKGDAAAAAKKDNSDGDSIIKFPKSTNNYAGGMARTKKLDFFDHFDLGVPMDPPTEKDSDVLILYSRKAAVPKTYESSKLDDGSIPLVGTEDAIENCESVNVILTKHGNKHNFCTAIVPQYESYHIQRWMRLGKKGVDTSEDLQLVSRGMQSNGVNQFEPPTKKNRAEAWEMLSNYYSTFKKATDVLKPLLEKVATPQKTVTVMVANFGQSELLANFVCAARLRQLDTSSIIVFATDPETEELAESLGLTAFYDKWNFESIPSEAAARYGDRKFTLMMMAKVMCVQMVSTLGYNILFQDVDIVWYKNPIPFFENTDDKSLQNYDMLFQDDGGHSTRYAPYSANSGFYYVRSNARTEHFFSALLNAADLVLKTDSHQQALIALMNEHVSLFGLKVKVFSRDTEEFPGGHTFHMRKEMMKKIIRGESNSYIFHMSWTLNKDNKMLFLKQFGEWYVEEKCVHKKPAELSFLDNSSHSPFADGCCSVEPLVSCHYRDKPSKNPCKDSPPIDQNGKSFW